MLWLLVSIMSTSSITPPATPLQSTALLQVVEHISSNLTNSGDIGSDAEIHSSSQAEDRRSSSGLRGGNEVITNISFNTFNNLASSNLLKASLPIQTPTHIQEHRMTEADFDNDQSLTASGQQGILQFSDLVVAIPTTHTRLVMILASRVWRRGLRTFITNDKQEQVSKLNNSPSAKAHNESYGFFPEDGGELMKYKRRAHYAGDPRQAMTPFMAHR